MTSHWLQLAQLDNRTPGYQAGFFAGLIIPTIFLAAGIAKCALISSRPTTNRKAILSLMFMLIAIVFAMTLGAVKQINPELHAVLLIAGLILFVITLLGLFLSVLGIIEIRADRAKYKQGIRQAICALILASIFFGLMILGLYKQLNRSSEEVARLAMPIQPVANEKIRVSEWNYQFESVAKPWVRTDPQRLSPEASLCFLRANPDMFFMICAVHLPEEVSNDRLVSTVEDHVRSLSDSCETVWRHPERIDNIDGVRILIRARIKGQSVSYIHWLGQGSGLAYQLTIFGLPSSESKMVEEAGEIFQHFSRIQPTPTQSIARNFTSSKYGYHVALDSTWHRWTNLITDVPDAEFGSLSGSETAFAVIPISLQGMNPDLDIITAAVLRRFNVNYEELPPPQKIPGETDGYRLSFNRKVKGVDYTYALKSIKRGDFAWFAIAWTSNWKMRDTIASIPDAMKLDDSIPSHVDESSLDGRETQALDEIYNEIGLQYLNRKQTDRAIDFFSRAFKLNPRHSIALENQIISLISVKRLPEARLLLQSAVVKFPERPLFKTKLAYVESELGNTDVAVSMYRQIYLDNYENDDSFLYYVTLLGRTGKVDEAIHACQRYLRHSSSVNVVINYAYALGLADKDEQAIAILKDWQAKLPNNPSLACAIIERYLHERQYAQAMENATALETSGQTSAYLYELKGRAQLGLKLYRDAKISLDIAIAKDPNDEYARQYLKTTAALLGEGDNTGIKNPIDPIKLPESIQQEALKPAAQPPDPSFGAYYLNRVVLLSYIPGKDYRTTVYRKIKILDHRGIETYSSMQFKFDPLTEEVYLNKLQVFDADGKLLSTGSATDCYVTDSKQGNIDSQEKVMNVPIPSLKPGCVVEMVTTTHDIAPDKQFRFFQESLSTTIPAVHAGVVYLGDPSLITHHTIGNFNFRQIDGGLAWMMDNVPAVPVEPDLPSVQDILPGVFIAQTGSTWDEQAKKYLASIADLLPPSSQVSSLAADLIKGASTDSEKAAALVHYVQHSINYKAIEFGRRSRIPQKGEIILRNRYGDCKDHALLLYQLLRSANIPANLSLVRTYGHILEDVPSLDQFDHMIVFAPTISGGAFFDCTDKDGCIDNGVPFWLSGEKVLKLDENNPALVAVHANPESATTASIQRKVQITPSGDVAINENLTCTGAFAWRLRNYFHMVDQSNRPRLVTDLLSRTGLNLNINDLQIDNADQAEKPLVLSLKATVRSRFSTVDQKLIGNLPAPWEHYFLNTEHLNSRQYPFKLYYPAQLQCQTMLSLPSGFSVESSPKPIDVTEDFAKSKINFASTSDGLNISSTVALPAGQYPPEKFSAFQSTREQLLRNLEPSLILIKK